MDSPPARLDRHLLEAYDFQAAVCEWERKRAMVTMIGAPDEAGTLVTEPPSPDGDARGDATRAKADDISMLQAEVELHRALLEMRARSRHNEPWLKLTTLRERSSEE